MRRWSLRGRFLLLLVGLLLAVFAAITLVIVRENTDTLRTDLINQSKSFAALATQPIGDAFITYQSSGTIAIQQQIDHFTSLDSNITQVEIVDTDGHKLFLRNPADPIKVSLEAATSLDPSYLHDANGNLTAIVQPLVESFGIHRYAIVYGVSYQSLNESITRVVISISILSALILLVSIGVWYLVINRFFIKPVSDVSHLALQISKGDLNQEIKIGRRDEIGDLAQAVNTMANSLKADITKLEALDKMKSEFLMITSHNLRTPLTIIKAYLDQIMSEKPDAKLRAALKPIDASVMRLGGFAEGMLTISTIEAGENVLAPQPTKIRPMILDISNQFSAMAEQKKIHFTAKTEADAWVSLSNFHFRSALWNLLDNAYKFTKSGGSISLTTRLNHERFEIEVRDDGIGIAPEEIPRLFTKFHRAQDVMTSEYEGTGIGLYITKIIIERHGGSVHVESQVGKGSTFTVSLPTIPPPESLTLPS